MSVEIRRNERGAWCVIVRGNFISDHATHAAARIVAQQVSEAEARIYAAERRALSNRMAP